MRLIACDLDGTLLHTGGTLGARNLAALHAARAAGIEVVLATGRPPAVLHLLLDALDGVASYGVMANGAFVGTLPDLAPLRTVRFSIDDAVDAVQRLRAADPGYGFALATTHGFAYEHGFAERMPAISPGRPVDDALVAVGEASEVIKLIVFHSQIESHRLLDVIPPLIGDALAVSHMGADAVELGPVGVDKGSGLVWLCGHLGIDAAEVVAFGDEYNDHEMLRWAGLGVAMANAPAATRELADEVTLTNDEDGVAVVVERLLAGR